MQPDMREPFDVNRAFEDEVRELVQHQVRREELPPPEYIPVNRQPDPEPQLGELVAEHIVRDWESAAKEIEALGEELKILAAKCESKTRDVLEAVKHVQETAAFYRDQGKRAFEQIEQAALRTEEVRSTCTALREKISQ